MSEGNENFFTLPSDLTDEQKRKALEDAFRGMLQYGGISMLGGQMGAWQGKAGSALDEILSSQKIPFKQNIRNANLPNMDSWRQKIFDYLSGGNY